ncbi:MAG: prolyl oligopeptidase family serine peptidase [Hyphomicrobiales bacterium]
MLTAERRARAERYLAPNLRPSLYNPQLRPHWIGAADRFWYRHESPDGVSFTLVDAATGIRQPAFDHAAAAAALAAVTDTPCHPQRLPIAALDLTALPMLRLRLPDGRWVRLPEIGAAVAEPPPPALRPGEVRSPDGTRAVFCRDHDLWLRDLATSGEVRLTSDGAAHHAYGKSPDMNLTTATLARRGIRLPANVMWSPDGRKLLTSRLDERDVLDLPLVQHVPDGGGARPVLLALKFAFSGDAALPLETHCIIDISTGRLTTGVSGPHVTGMTTCIEKEEAWWSADSTRVFFLDRDRFWQRLTLSELTAATGIVRAVHTETAATFIDTNLSVLGLPNIRVLEASGEFIWFSQQDGWAHLYLHDLATGALKHRITQGDWVVRDLVHVDEAARSIEFLAAGLDSRDNPYHRTLCRIGLDGTGLAVLTPGGGDHALAMPIKRIPRDHIRPEPEIGAWRAPSGHYFVHTRSDLTTLPVSDLRRADGTLVARLATTDIAAGLAADWRWPTPFRVSAADDRTELFGALWRPTDFDPSRKYPVIDYIYPGPQRGQLPTVMLTDILPELGRACLPQAFAELGFVVIAVDGRGTPLRSKAFHDLCYGNLHDPGTLADHVATLRQLAARHAWIDLSRVGIMGHSGGGYASVRALLDYPDVFHAAVATAGNHDQMGYSFAWAEKYMGPVTHHADGTTNYSRAANAPYASNLRGKLLLATGDMDDNVHPALTMQLAAALIAADKDFDFVPLPNDDHTTVWAKPYFLRRAMEFMVRCLAAD